MLLVFWEEEETALAFNCAEWTWNRSSKFEQFIAKKQYIEETETKLRHHYIINERSSVKTNGI
jgi:hypothetical protein